MDLPHTHARARERFTYLLICQRIENISLHYFATVLVGFELITYIFSNLLIFGIMFRLLLLLLLVYY